MTRAKRDNHWLLSKDQQTTDATQLAPRSSDTISAGVALFVLLAVFSSMVASWPPVAGKVVKSIHLNFHLS
jgi:hypothetical protein